MQIWNARVEQAAEQYPQLRTIVLTRDMERFQFKVFEYTAVQYDPADYVWNFRPSKRTIEGRTVDGNVHTFSWQSNGAQFTIIRPPSGSARSFEIKKPEPLNPQQMLASLGYSEDWVTFL